MYESTDMSARQNHGSCICNSEKWWYGAGGVWPRAAIVESRAVTAAGYVTEHECNAKPASCLDLHRRWRYVSNLWSLIMWKMSGPPKLAAQRSAAPAFACCCCCREIGFDSLVSKKGSYSICRKNIIAHFRGGRSCTSLFMWPVPWGNLYEPWDVAESLQLLVCTWAYCFCSRSRVSVCFRLFCFLDFVPCLTRPTRLLWIGLLIPYFLLMPHSRSPNRVDFLKKECCFTKHWNFDSIMNMPHVCNP